MNKGSHISLAHFLVDKMDIADLHAYKKSFLFGSILPDCLPSFFTTKHTMNETFDLLKVEIGKISDNYDKEKGITTYYCRHLGVITHYLADYFTFPHNPGFCGTAKEHWNYEKELATVLQSYLEHCESVQFTTINEHLHTVEQISNFIIGMHEEYIRLVQDIRMDCRFIVMLCYCVLEAILSLLGANNEIVHSEQIQAA